MPKAKNKSSLDDTDYDQSQTQTMTQAERAINSAGPGEVERRTNELVQYLLIMDQKKKPITRQEINKVVLRELSKTFPAMLKKANTTLNDVFGMDLIEIEGKGAKSYILVNLIDRADSSHIVWPAEDNARMGLMMTILAVIFMKGGILVDSDLFHFLRKLGVDHEVPHSCFGDVKKLLKESVQQKYLETSLVPNTDPPVYEYRWGQRAKAELTERDALQFVCQIYKTEDMKQWTTQWQQVLESERKDDPNNPQ